MDIISPAFVLLLSAWAGDSPAADVYVLDSGLTGEDCIQGILDINEQDPRWSNGVPSCEVDGTGALVNGSFLSYCAYEDSDNCFWDATLLGNGSGQSFYSLDGEIHHLNY